MGIKAQMGHMAEWIELQKEKVKEIEPDQAFRMTLNNGLSTGTFVVNNNKMMVKQEPSVAVQSQLQIPNTPIVGIRNKYENSSTRPISVGTSRSRPISGLSVKNQ